MALLDFMKEGFNSLQSQPQMYDPHANAKRLMGGPVQEQQGGGTGFNFFGGNNASQNAQEPLPQNGCYRNSWWSKHDTIPRPRGRTISFRCN